MTEDAWRQWVREEVTGTVSRLCTRHMDSRSPQDVFEEFIAGQRTVRPWFGVATDQRAMVAAHEYGPLSDYQALPAHVTVCFRGVVAPCSFMFDTASGAAGELINILPCDIDHWFVTKEPVDGRGLAAMIVRAGLGRTCMPMLSQQLCDTAWQRCGSVCSGRRSNEAPGGHGGAHTQRRGVVKG